jgi:hypothetical protein
MVSHACDHLHGRQRLGRLIFEARQDKKERVDLKNNEITEGWDVVQEAEHPPIKCEASSSNPRATKERRARKESSLGVS